MQRLTGLYKFERAKSAYKELGDLLIQTISELPVDAIIVLVPTARSHVREQGYDHTVLLVRYVAEQRHLTFAQPLVQMMGTMQRH